MEKQNKNIIMHNNEYKAIMKRKTTHTKKSIKKAICAFCDLGGFQMQQVVRVRMYSKDRLIFAGIDLLRLQNAILELPDRCLEAVSQFGFNEPYNKQDLEYAITLLADKLKLNVYY